MGKHTKHGIIYVALVYPRMLEVNKEEKWGMDIFFSEISRSVHISTPCFRWICEIFLVLLDALWCCDRDCL